MEFAKVLTVCKAEIWQTHHYFGSGSCHIRLSKMHVDEYVLGKGFGCAGTLSDDMDMDSYVSP